MNAEQLLKIIGEQTVQIRMMAAEIERLKAAVSKPVKEEDK